MSRSLHFTCYGLPQTAGSKRAFVRKGRAIVTDDNPKSKGWKQEIANVALQSMPHEPGEVSVPLSGPLTVRFLFILPRPKGHTGKKGLLPSAPVYPITRPDVLKLARSAEDALTGIVWLDDAQIVDETLNKRYGVPPRVEVTVSEL